MHRRCWPSCGPFRSSASRRCPSRSKSTCRPARSRRRCSSACPRRPVRESTHRVERALVNSGFQRPHDRVVINLAPAELPKQAASFDLPISLGMLAGSGQIASERFRRLCRRRRTGLGRLHPADARGSVDRHGRGSAAGPEGAGRAHFQRGRSGRGRRAGGDRRRQPDAGGRFLHRRIGHRPHAAAIATVVRRIRELRRRLFRRPRPGTCQAGHHDLGQRRRTICSCWARQARARRCWPSGCRRFCRS